jgi:histidyl-tRNA synthetase
MPAVRIPVRGCRDILPSSAATRRAIVSRFADLARVHGFVEVDTPVLEHAALFASALGETSDVIASELFLVEGGKGDGGRAGGGEGNRGKAIPSPTERRAKQVVLRPEGTAGIARAFAPKDKSFESRVWYTGPMFRYERPQKLRLRQFTQIGVECLGGDGSIGTDIDTIVLAHRFLDTTLGAAKASLTINTLGSLADRASYNESLAMWLRPRYSSLSALSRTRFDAGNCMRILDSKLSEDQDALHGAPLLLDHVGSAERDRFSMLQDLLCDAGVSFVVSPMLVRGLDYYTQTAFEFIDESGRAVCAGGRYEDVQGASGVGFAAGLERLEMPSAAKQLTDAAAYLDASPLGGPRNGVAVIALSSSHTSPTAQAGNLAVRQLRQAGVCAVGRLVATKVAKAIGRAVRDGAGAIVLVGSDDIAAGVVQVKLVDGTTHETRHQQRAMHIDEAVDLIAGHVGIGVQNDP